MELGVKSPPQIRSPSPSNPLSPTRLAKLPPIASTGGLSDDGERVDPTVYASSALMQSACTELKDSMGHLQNEAQSAESRIQKAIESMWHKMMEMLASRVKEYEKKLSEERAELAGTKEQLARSQAQEASLVQQNARMSMELVVAEKKEKKLEGQVSELETRISAEKTQFSKAEWEWNSQKNKDRTELEGVEKELFEKSKVLREYQEKLSKMTEKVQKLTRGLAAEKASAEQLQKTSSDHSIQQTAENRKLALEISKLKTQLNSSGGTVTAGKEEVKRLTQAMMCQQTKSEENLEKLRQQNNKRVQKLESKIAELEEKIERLKTEHKAEIDELLLKLRKALAHEVDDYLDARIKFLRHQNQQEKIKISREPKTKQ